MSYHDQVQDLADDPRQLEVVFQEAEQSGETEAFKTAIDSGYTAEPDNLLYAAWYYRLKQGAAQAYTTAWGWVIPLAVINGLIFWGLSGERFDLFISGFQNQGYDFIPAIIVLAGPITAVFVLFYMVFAGRRSRRAAAVISLLLIIAAAYVIIVYPRLGLIPFQEQYLTLMVIHLPLLAWAGVGFFLLFKGENGTGRFAFLIKSFEAIIFGGLFLIAGVLFTGITIGLFQALSVDFPEEVMRLFIAGGVGLVSVIAVGVIYHPALPPGEQSFEEGLSKLVALLMRLMLPLTLLVLLIYLLFIPFNFRAPFESRDVLIIYNAMLFAVIGLLVGATPVSLAQVSPTLAGWLRRGIIAVAALALLVSLYALAAIIYRTAIDRLTPNRLAFMGWNVINIGLLFLILLYQLRAKKGRWLPGLYRAYSVGMVAYAAWTILLIIALPWLFGRDLAVVQGLPESVQKIAYEQPDPILLKCHDSPHIYLLDGGQKRWINSITTFNGQGYGWRDVRFVRCADLSLVPDGLPIPAGAGPPPQP